MGSFRCARGCTLHSACIARGIPLLIVLTPPHPKYWPASRASLSARPMRRAASRAVHKACVQCTLIQVARALHCCLCLCMNACRVSGDQRDTRLTLGLLGRALPAARRLSASNSTESCLFHFQPFARVLTPPQYVQGKHKRHGGGKFLAPMHARYQSFCANGVPKSGQIRGVHVRRV